MSHIKHLATYMFQTLMVRNVRLTRKSKISRLTRLRLCALSKALMGTSCLSSVEIEDGSLKAPGCLHFRTLTVQNVRLTRKSKISRLTRLRLFHYPKTLCTLGGCSLKHLAAYMFRTPTVWNVHLTRKSNISCLTRLRLLHYLKTYGMLCAPSIEI